MFVIALLPFVFVAGIVFLAMRARTKPIDIAVAVTPWLERWRSVGLVTEEQVDSILTYEKVHSPASNEDVPSPPAAAEALGYGGALLAAVGIAIMIDRFDLSQQAGAVFAGCVAIFLIVASRFVNPDRGPEWWRLNQVVALLGAAALAVAVGIQTGGVARMSPAATSFVIGATLSVVGWFLYRRRDLPLQQLGLFAAVVATIVGATLLIDPDGRITAGGLLILGICWIAGARRQVFPPALLAFILGGLLTALSPNIWANSWPMFAFPAAAAIAALLIIVGGLDKRPALLTIGLLALLQAAPASIGATAGSWVGAIVALGFVVFGASLIRWGWSREEGAEWVSHTTGAILLALTGGAIAATWQLSGLIVGAVIASALVALGTTYRRGIVGGIGLLAFAIYVPWLIASEFGGGAVPIGLVVVGVGGIGVAVLMLARRPTEVPKGLE